MNEWMRHLYNFYSTSEKHKNKLTVHKTDWKKKIVGLCTLSFSWAGRPWWYCWTLDGLLIESLVQPLPVGLHLGGLQSVCVHIPYSRQERRSGTPAGAIRKTCEGSRLGVAFEGHVGRILQRSILRRMQSLNWDTAYEWEQWCSLVFCSEYTVIFFPSQPHTHPSRAASHQHHTH